jgi:type I restriction enzyme, S subunit
VLARAMLGDDGHTWPLVPLAKLITEGPTNGYSPRAGDNPRGTLSLKLTATTRGVLDLSERGVKRLNETIPESSKYWLRPGDLLIQRANSLEYVGVAALFDGPANTYIYPDLMMRIRVTSPTLATWIWRYLGSSAARHYFMSNASGTAGNMPKINGTTVKRMLIPLPPPEQLELALKKLSDALDAVQRISVEATKASVLASRLEGEAMNKAFRGELVARNCRLPFKASKVG